MNARERVLAALDRTPADRVPVDLFEGWLWPGLEQKLFQCYELADREALLRRLGADVRHSGPAYVGPAPRAGPTDLPNPEYTTSGLQINVWGTVSGLESYADGVGIRPLQDARTVEEIESHSWPDPEWFDFQELPVWARRNATYSLWVGGFSPLFSLLADLCGMQTALTNLVLRPDLVRAIVRNVHRFYRGYYSNLIRNGRGHLDVIGFGDDFASQNAMMFSPIMWREFFKPVWADLFALAKDSGMRVLFHSCGAVRDIIPDLIEIGLDILYPVQTRAAGMEPTRLKADFGDRLSFYGGVDTQWTMPYGTPEDVRREVRERIEVLGRGGGYIVSTTHVLMNDVPPENVVALYDEATRSE